MKLKAWSEMLPFARAVYDRHGAGCCWHIALDDGNLDDDDVEFCADNVDRYEAAGECDTKGACRNLIPMMRAATKTQRRKLYRNGSFFR